MTTTTSPLKVGVLLPGTVQLLDLSAIDLIYMTTPDYLASCGLPTPLVNLGRPCEIHYIGLAGAGSLQECTAKLFLRLTDGVDDKPVAPGALDVLMIPGPEPDVVPETAYLEYVRRHYEAATTILSICTGIFVCGYAGIVRQKRVTGPRGLIPMLKARFPEAGVWDSEMRVVRDGRLWTSGGITNGHDLVAEYLRETYPNALVNTILAMADVAKRSRKYENGVSRDNMFFLWQFMRALPSVMFRMLRA